MSAAIHASRDPFASTVEAAWNGQPTARLALTPREVEVLRLYATGVTTEAIARQEHIAIQTVRNHLTSAYRKLGVSGSVEAFIVMGWLTVP